MRGGDIVALWVPRSTIRRERCFTVSRRNSLWTRRHQVRACLGRDAPRLQGDDNQRRLDFHGYRGHSEGPDVHVQGQFCLTSHEYSKAMISISAGPIRYRKLWIWLTI